MLDEVAGPEVSSAALRRAGLIAMLGRFDEAWALALPVAERARELNGDDAADFALGEIAVTRGRSWSCGGLVPPRLPRLRSAWDAGRCSRASRRSSAARCASSAATTKRSRWPSRGASSETSRDYVTQMYWRQVKALVLAHRGEHREAERLARESVQVTEATDALNDQADAYYYLARVLAKRGDRDDAAEALEQALDRYERKKNLAMVAQVKPKLEELRAHVS